MQLFRADSAIFKKKVSCFIFGPAKMKKKKLISKAAHNHPKCFVSIANWPKINPSFCSIKMVPCVTYI